MSRGIGFLTLDGRASPAEQLAASAGRSLDQAINDFSAKECRRLLYDWRFWARPNQLAPAGDWFCWLVLAGRGFGKTRMGAEWVREFVEGRSPLMAPGKKSRIAFLSQTLIDAREVMVDGESGIVATSRPGFRPSYETSRRRLVWPNGATATLYSAEEPDQLRGPQHHLAWGDELAKWRNQDAVWANLLMGLRLGEAPRVMVTTTPRPTRLVKRLVADPTTAVTYGSTFDNAAHLSPEFLYHIKRLYEGTRLGRQELNGEILEDIEGALWHRGLIDRARVRTSPDLVRIVVAVDPPVSKGPEANNCGIVVAGRCEQGDVYVLADLSEGGLSPNQWASKALAALEHFDGDCLVAEVNQGGDLVETVLRQISPHVPYRAVRASRGKMTRAEPVALLYERGLVHHAGCFDALEDELCSYTGEPGEVSPDRLDALVWAITDLVLKSGQPPRVRML